MLASKDLINDIPALFVPRNDLRKTGKFKTRRFYFSVKLFLPGDTFT